MMKKLFLCLLLALLALPVAAVDITVDGVKRSYVIYLPKNLGQNRPLLISCHGMNQDANYQKGMLQIESIADTAKFVTVFPEGIDRGWDISGDRDIRFMQAIIDEHENSGQNSAQNLAENGENSEQNSTQNSEQNSAINSSGQC